MDGKLKLQDITIYAGIRNVGGRDRKVKAYHFAHEEGSGTITCFDDLTQLDLPSSEPIFLTQRTVLALSRIFYELSNWESRVHVEVRDGRVDKVYTEQERITSVTVEYPNGDTEELEPTPYRELGDE